MSKIAFRSQGWEGHMKAFEQISYLGIYMKNPDVPI